MDIQKEKKAIKNLKAFYMEDWNLTEEERDDLDNLVSRIVAVVKTEAQAVPEGFVLVPEGLTHEQAARISDDENFFETYQTILTESDTSEDSAVILIQTAHKAMIKAQEPAND